jgi:hypothetical protein
MSVTRYRNQRKGQLVGLNSLFNKSIHCDQWRVFFTVNSDRLAQYSESYSKETQRIKPVCRIGSAEAGIVGRRSARTVTAVPSARHRSTGPPREKPAGICRTALKQSARLFPASVWKTSSPDDPAVEEREAAMVALLGLLLVIWLACVVVGIVVKGLVWLIILGAVLFVATSVVGFVKREALGRR